MYSVRKIGGPGVAPTSVPALVISLSLLLTGLQCVTEPSRRTVSVHAVGSGRIYPAASYYGQWVSGMGVLKIQRPPRAAIVIIPHSRAYRPRTDDYKIVTLVRNKDGSDTFQLEPLGSGPKIILVLTVDTRDKLRETGGSPRLWRRMGTR